MKLLLYCTKVQPFLIQNPDWIIRMGKQKYIISKDNLYAEDITLNGKVVAECDFEVEEIFYKDGSLAEAELGLLGYRTNTWEEFSLLQKSCLSFTQLENYLKDKDIVYAIHIKNLHIFNKPKELKEFYKIENLGGMLFTKQLIKAPQNMMRVSTNDWEYMTYNPNDIRILISIHPEWLCKILNGYKTIEVRKEVLKEMI